MVIPPANSPFVRAALQGAGVALVPSVRVHVPYPEVPDLGACGDCGRDLVCLVDSLRAVFCEHCDLGISLAGQPAGRR
ncbi:hypothetical protein [Streptomyces sp. NPDC018693]|uniref:hypothetical protein n=1 Tax=unclassified Streptomyces TaxID=2593676 RepID=UPI00379A1B0B